MWPTLPCLCFPKFANIFYRKFTIITPKRVIKKKKKKKKKKEELEACSFSKRKKEREPKPEHETRNTEGAREIKICGLMRAKVWKKKCPSGNTI